MDSKNKACVRFRFFVGQDKLVVKSKATQRICFENKMTFEFANDDYSKLIAQNFKFEKPIKIKVLFKN